MSTPKTSKTLDILLVEDNPGDVRLTREALKRGQEPSNLHVAQDGEEALAYLRRHGEHANAVRPNLILLDLKMPRMDGRTLLAELKKDPKLRTIPVIVFTSSDSPLDVFQSYDLQASCYVTKPTDLNKYREIVCLIEDFWQNAVRLP